MLLPIILGLIVQRPLGERMKLAMDVLPLIPVASIVAMAAAASQAKIAEPDVLIMAVVIPHNDIGLAIGYFAGRVVAIPLAQRKTLSIEVGMQSPGLGAALTSAHFSPPAAMPSALFRAWHNLSGPLLATLYRRTGQDYGKT
ncbi:hypothetical protein D3C86_1809390 [compost metagenome]